MKGVDEPLGSMPGFLPSAIAAHRRETSRKASGRIRSIHFFPSFKELVVAMASKVCRRTKGVSLGVRMECEGLATEGVREGIVMADLDTPGNYFYMRPLLARNSRKSLMDKPWSSPK
jgi:hypothetical protein